jgi:hypothetical protein
MSRSRIGIDLGKNSFHLVGLDQRGPLAHKSCEGCIDLAAGPGGENLNLQPHGAGGDLGDAAAAMTGPSVWPSYGLPCSAFACSTNCPPLGAVTGVAIETLQPNSYGARALPRPMHSTSARATSRPLARADAALDAEHEARERAVGQSSFRALCCPRSCGECHG